MDLDHFDGIEAGNKAADLQNESILDGAAGAVGAPNTDNGSQDLQYHAVAAAKDYHKRRWKRLGKHYNDRYLDLFQQGQQTVELGEPLLLSQHGSVLWTPLEKERFFSALARKGRHDVPAMSAAVGSKSEVEVMQFLLMLKDSALDRQQFSRYPKNVSHAEIDSAVEVDDELDAALEKAAKALAALQDYYDLSATEKNDEGIWLVDAATAAYVEHKCDEVEDDGFEDGRVADFTADESKNDALGMFHVGTMLELSRELFMNTAPQANLDHWTEVAEDDEEPSVTLDAIQSYYNLVKSLVQRVLQSAVFLAESRLRSTTNRYAPARALRDTDVVAALSILNMPVDSFEHWVKFPRRSGLRVVLGSHGKAEAATQDLSLEQVEDALSVRASRGRRRSLSSMANMTSQDEFLEDEIVGGNGLESNDTDRQLSQMPEERLPGLSSGDMRQSLSTSDDELIDSSFSDENSSSIDTASNNSSDEGVAAAQDTDLVGSRKRRRLMLEQAQDDFLEKLDDSAKIGEAVRLRRVLGFADNEETPEPDLGKRPKTLRSLMEDVQDWSELLYRSEWERKRSAQKAFGNTVEARDTP